MLESLVASDSLFACLIPMRKTQGRNNCLRCLFSAHEYLFRVSDRFIMFINYIFPFPKVSSDRKWDNEGVLYIGLV